MALFTMLKVVGQILFDPTLAGCGKNVEISMVIPPLVL